MEYSYDKIKAYLGNYINETNISKIILAQEQPLTTETYRQLLPWSRLIIPISGEKTICFANNAIIQDFVLKPGEIVFIPPWGWSIPRWTTSHEMISIVFEHCYIRILYINHENGMTRGRRSPDYYFHIEDSISLSTVHLIQAISTMPAANCKKSDIAVKMVQCLLDMVYADIKNSHQKTHSQAYCTWQQIRNYINENYNNKISRYSIAEIFCITPQYISKLFKKYGNRGFHNYLNWIRLTNAASLLEKTKLSVDEISWQCGYAHNSHFIKLFRQEYGLSPGRYRTGLLKSNNQ